MPSDGTGTTQLQDPVRRDILSKEELEALLSNSGIANDDLIILYGDNNNWFAVYAYWQLKIYGHEKVKLMNGGRQKWVAENRPLTTDVPTPTPTNYQAKEANKELRGSVPGRALRVGQGGRRTGRRPLTPGV